jgi:hypothetical protein
MLGSFHNCVEARFEQHGITTEDTFIKKRGSTRQDETPIIRNSRCMFPHDLGNRRREGYPLEARCLLLKISIAPTTGMIHHLLRTNVKVIPVHLFTTFAIETPSHSLERP